MAEQVGNGRCPTFFFPFHFLINRRYALLVVQSTFICTQFTVSIVWFGHCLIKLQDFQFWPTLNNYGDWIEKELSHSYSKSSNPQNSSFASASSSGIFHLSVSTYRSSIMLSTCQYEKTHRSFKLHLCSCSHPKRSITFQFAMISIYETLETTTSLAKSALFGFFSWPVWGSHLLMNSWKRENLRESQDQNFH